MANSPGRWYRAWLLSAALLALLAFTLFGFFLEDEGLADAGRISIACVLGLVWSHRAGR